MDAIYRGTSSPYEFDKFIFEINIKQALIWPMGTRVIPREKPFFDSYYIPR